MEAIDIDKLEAGSELDDLIAEHVMGWERSGSDWKITREQWPSSGKFPPNYSTDIAAAWQVVEKLLADDYRFALDNREGLPWWAEFALPDYSEGDQDIAETPTLAICRAALKAVMATQLAIQPSQTP